MHPGPDSLAYNRVEEHHSICFYLAGLTPAFSFTYGFLIFGLTYKISVDSPFSGSRFANEKPKPSGDKIGYFYPAGSQPEI